MVSETGVQRTELRRVPRSLDLSEEPPVSNTASPDPSAFMIKTFGSTIRDLSFNRLTPGKIVEMESYQSILACLIAGAGIALMPRSTLETMPGRSSVNVFELAAQFRNVNTWLFWRKESHHPDVRALLSLLKAASPLATIAAISSLPQRLD